MAITSFVYGTLMDPTVWRRVTNGTARKVTPAVIRGYRRYQVKHGYYPGILRTFDDADLVHGLLVTFDGQVTVDALDRFETEMYMRVPVQAETGTVPTALPASLLAAIEPEREPTHPSAALHAAEVYVWVDGEHLLDMTGADWSYDEFCASQRRAFDAEMAQK
ncbi:hypothetical protein GGF32_009556 [Allomyces javanicus]|nr:hypothetical protein GGF32_009556 [Allomyces javanicus]